MRKRFPNFRQFDNKDCGPTCLRIICKYYGKTFSLDFIRKQTFITKEGVSFLGIKQAAEFLGFKSMAVLVDYEKLLEAPLPCILHWTETHFVVLYKITKTRAYISDPSGVRLKLGKEEFCNNWMNRKKRVDNKKGSVLLLSPTEIFYDQESQITPSVNLAQLFRYLKPYKQFQWLLIIGILAGTAIQFTIPFIFQTIVDTGIRFKNASFITMILGAQLALILSKLVFDFCRDYLLLNISIRLNTHIIYDFLAKLLSLPLSFFDTKMTGDILRRIEDNNRVEKLLSSSTLNFLFSILTFAVFGVVLAIYNHVILLVYLLFTVMYVSYVFSFLKKRAEYDMRKFYELSQNQNLLLQVIHGIAEIKLNNSEEYKKNEWSKIQNMIFKTKISAARLVQFQESGAYLINEIRNLIIIFISAKLVISGNITLGTMLSIQYIIGFLNQAINQSVYFVREFQDAKISLERIMEIQSIQSENDGRSSDLTNTTGDHIKISNLTFRYEGPNSPSVLDKVNLDVTNGSIIAIVGTSGSGKTTLMKLLLNFYDPVEGSICLGEQNLKFVKPSEWRKKCGVVMQDGFTFSDTIAKNISLSDKDIDRKKLKHAMEVANIHEFVDELPLKENTMIGQEGIGLSHGQKQRLLIARAVYKNPDYLFFDEATSALDANNEKKIMENLNEFFKHKTVFIIAHRLSTVKNAGKIIVLEKGCLIEEGTHTELIAKKGNYFNLVKNQLELGS